VRLQPDETTTAEPTSGVEFAAYFVALQPGGVERILRRHYAMPNGLCAGCLARPTMYPCQAARIAELATHHAEYRKPTPATETVPQLPTFPHRPSTARQNSKHQRQR